MNLLIPFLTSAIIVIVITPLTIKLAQKFGLVDDPLTHKHPAIIHKRTLPRAGGLPIYIGILVTILIFFGNNPIFVPILIAVQSSVQLVDRQVIYREHHTGPTSPLRQL